jgi:hypothetical protein
MEDEKTQETSQKALIESDPGILFGEKTVEIRFARPFAFAMDGKPIDDAPTKIVLPTEGFTASQVMSLRSFDDMDKFEFIIAFLATMSGKPAPILNRMDAVDFFRCYRVVQAILKKVLSAAGFQ